MKARITLITLGVDDLHRSVDFYRDGLGLPTNGIVGAEFEYGAVAFFDLQPGLKLAVWPRASLAHDAGIAKSGPSPTNLSIGHNLAQQGRGRRRDGAGQEGWRDDRQAGAGDVLGRLCRLLPGPRRASVGAGLEPAHLPQD